MTQKNPVVVLVLTFVTLGIYGIIWIARTRGEMVARGAQIPTTWLIIIPFVNLFYYWKWSKGVEHVVRRERRADVHPVAAPVAGGDDLRAGAVQQGRRRRRPGGGDRLIELR